MLVGSQGSLCYPSHFGSRYIPRLLRVALALVGFDSSCACDQKPFCAQVTRHSDQAKTLPGRLELPTLRLTASRSNQLS